MSKELQSASVIMAIALGTAATLWGFSQVSWPAALPFAWDSLYLYIAFILIGALSLEAISRKFKINRLFAGGVAALLIAVVTSNVWPLLVVLWFAFASYVTGRAILALLKIDKASTPNITATLIGAAAYGTAVGLAAHFPINYPGLYGLALGAPVVLGWRGVYDVIRPFWQQLNQASESKWLDLGIALIALYHFAVALMPEVGHDALAMHLFIPGHLATRHEWGFDVTTYVWAVMPMMGDWLFSIGYMLAGETAARLINVGFIFVLCWLLRDLVMWAGGNAIGARWAILLFLSTPLTFTESSSLFIESVWASFVVAGSLSVFKLFQSDHDQSTHLPMAGILLGGALASKAVTLTILPVLLLLMVLSYRTSFRWSLIRVLALSLILLFAVGVIPYATAWFITGNPVFPFFNQVFQSPFWPVVNFEAPAVFAKGLSWDILYQITFHSERFLESRLGAAGFQWMLIFVPALLALIFVKQHKGAILFVVAALSVVLTFQSIAYLRYVFPSFVWVAAGLGVAMSTGGTGSVFIRRSLAIVGWTVVVLNLFFFNSGTYYGNLSLRSLTSASGQEAYLNSQLPIRNAVEVVNRLNTGRTPVAVFSSPLTGGLIADGLYPNWYNYQFQRLVTEAGSAEEIAQLLLGKGVDYVILDSLWGSGEKRKFIEDATEKLLELGAITVRKVHSSYRFQTELLMNLDFSSYNGWALSAGVKDQSSDGLITVTVKSPATQIVPVVAGQRYQNSVTAVCADQPSQGRLQVNWLDSKSNFINTVIQLFDCTQSEGVHSMEVVAPRDASKAVVYVSGHTDVPIIFSEVSFKQ